MLTAFLVAIGIVVLSIVVTWSELGVNGIAGIVVFLLLWSLSSGLMAYSAWSLGVSAFGIGIGGSGAYLNVLIIRALWNDFPRF